MKMGNASNVNLACQLLSLAPISPHQGRWMEWQKLRKSSAFDTCPILSYHECKCWALFVLVWTRHCKSLELRPNEERLAVVMSRDKLKLFTEVLTSHSALNKHIHRIDRANFPLCKDCRSSEEITVYLLVTCVAADLLLGQSTKRT